MTTHGNLGAKSRNAEAVKAVTALPAIFPRLTLARTHHYKSATTLRDNYLTVKALEGYTLVYKCLHEKWSVHNIFIVTIKMQLDLWLQ